jgi:hypothetical protein
MEKQTKRAIKKVQQILDWKVQEFRQNDVFLRKMKALLQRKRDGSVYSYYFVLKRGEYPRWREKGEVLKRFGISKIIEKHEYTYFFAKNRDSLERYIEYLKLNRPIPIFNILEKPLTVFPYKYSYVYQDGKLHLSIEPDPDVVKGWRMLEKEVFISSKLPLPQMIEKVNFIRWKVFNATKYAFWDMGIIGRQDLEIWEIRHNFRYKKGKIIDVKKMLSYYQDYKEQSKKFARKMTNPGYAYVNSKEFEKKLKKNTLLSTLKTSI